ncbi:hypothetical protein [Plastoroseomonas arctica]|uniref:Uncharacterized protein n=1 Tax=Plastoroseomonas arctica TaxID=1509237 RepID=A0AAF1K4H2_9PROT|nr:hypothetical protein [Plastoroseomonas arctica]MBR0656019.1 hypothetical protein [Plastoroseomonas arctica]
MGAANNVISFPPSTEDRRRIAIRRLFTAFEAQTQAMADLRSFLGVNPASETEGTDQVLN